jgi:hypothetical protein
MCFSLTVSCCYRVGLFEVGVIMRSCSHSLVLCELLWLVACISLSAVKPFPRKVFWALEVSKATADSRASLRKIVARL